VAEPLPPPGVDRDALYDAIVAVLGEEKGQAWLEWHETTWPRWARLGWRALEKAHEKCAAAQNGARVTSGLNPPRYPL